MLNPDHFRLSFRTLIKLLTELKSLFLVRRLEGLMPHLRCHLFRRHILIFNEFFGCAICADQEAVESIAISQVSV
jgi:hypothetical protein